MFSARNLVFMLCAACLFAALAGCGVKGEKLEDIYSGYIVSPPDKVILALIDGSEGVNVHNNEVKSYLERPLQNMGFDVTYYDVNQGLPPGVLTRDIRGIITWFGDSKMKKAARYCEWLGEQMGQGKKLVIFDNFGAYQDAKTGEWTDMNLVNSVFTKLGVVYKAEWTSDYEVLEVAYKDGDVYEKEEEIDLKRIGHYYLFEKTGDGVKPFLVVRRKDLENSESAVIFASSAGGMALSRYILVVDEDTGESKPNLYVSNFLSECLFHVKADRQKTLIVWDKKTTHADYMHNLIKTLEYAKVDFEILDFKDISKLLGPDYGEYASLIIYSEELWAIDKEYVVSGIKEYVRGGGGILVPVRCMNLLFLDIFGIEDVEGFHGSQLEGMKVDPSFLPGAEEVYYPEDSLSHNSMKIKLKPGVKILARALTTDKDNPEGIPVCWRNDHGKGRVIFWNSDAMDMVYAPLRGFLLQSLMMAQPVSVHFLANIEMMHMDDFPVPMYNMYKEPVKSFYNMTDTEFYRNVWWKSLLEVINEFGIRLSCYAIFNYDARTKFPFEGRDFDFGEGGAYKWFTQEIINNNFELGFHGYNHQSLTIEGVDYAGWEEPDDMKQSLDAAKKLWQEVFPEQEEAFSYVAPMNVISPEGKRLLHETFPGIRVISKLLSKEDEGARFQEFGPDPDVPALYGIPRMTAGYGFDQKTKNGMIGNLNVFGVWSHFLHPDDIFGRYALGLEKTEGYGREEEDKDEKWEDMLASYRSMLTFVREDFPWLRNMTTKEAYYELVQYFSERAVVKIDEEQVTVFFSSGSFRDRFFAVRISDGKDIASFENCELVHSYPDKGVHVFRTDRSAARIKLTDKGQVAR